MAEASSIPRSPRPPRNRRLYSKDEMEAELGRRLAAALREKEWDGQLREITTRLDHANGLKEQMVTKEDFRTFREDLEARLDSFVALTPDKKKVLEIRLDRDAVAAVNLENRNFADERRLRRREVWAFVVTAAVGILALGFDAWSRLHG